jgi:hypothetical protein
MKNYLIKLYQDYGSHKSHDLIEVDEVEMYEWIVKSKEDDVRIEIYKPELLCDLS